MKSPISLKVSTKIPEKSSGRTLDALVDIIRPFTERRGLKADQIRLQREEVAIQIAEMAHKRLKIEKAEIKPIAYKGLVPFLEKSSLEDPDDEVMISMWANLLASAATSGDENLARHSAVLAEMNGKQAVVLSKLISRGAWADDKLEFFELARSRWTNEHPIIASSLKRKKRRGYHSALLAMKEELEHPGVALEFIEVHARGVDYNWPLDGDEWDETVFGDDADIELGALEGLNLVKHERLIHLPFREGYFNISFFRVTSFGADLYARCNPDKFFDFPPGKRQSTNTGASST